MDEKKLTAVIPKMKLNELFLENVPNLKKKFWKLKFYTFKIMT